MDKTSELKQERAALIFRGREILDAASDAKRDLTAEETAEYDKLNANIDTLGGTIAREERQRDLELGLDARSRSFDPRSHAAGGEQNADQQRKEYASTFMAYVRYGQDALEPEQRQLLRTGFVSEGVFAADQAKGTNTLGGFTVPQDFERQLVEHQVQAGAMRQTRATVIRTDNGQDLPVPKTTAHGTMTWTAEAAAITGDSETFGQVTLKAYKGTRMIKVSSELLTDTGVDLTGYLARAIGFTFGLGQNTAFLVGTGTTQPTGITTLSTLGVTAASATAIAADELVKLYYSVSPPYRRNAEWMMADLTIQAVRLLKDSQGHYLWLPGLQASETDTLLGKPVFSDPDMPALATGNKTILFGDMSAYWIRDVGGFTLRRLEERYADNDQVGFLATARTDGNLIDQTGSVKHLLMA